MEGAAKAIESTPRAVSSHMWKRMTLVVRLTLGSSLRFGVIVNLRAVCSVVRSGREGSEG